MKTFFRTTVEKLPRPQRSTLLTGAVFAVTAVLYMMVGIDSAETPATPAIPVYIEPAPTPTTTPAPTTQVPDSTGPTTSEPDTSEPDTTEPDTSEPDTTEPAVSDPENSSEADVGNAIDAGDAVDDPSRTN